MKALVFEFMVAFRVYQPACEPCVKFNLSLIRCNRELQEGPWCICIFEADQSLSTINQLS